MILNISESTEKELKTPSIPFKWEEGYNDPWELQENLKQTLIEHKGISLTSIQCGGPVQCFVLGNYADPDSVMGIFNPRIVDQSKEMSFSEESSLTFPGLYVKVKRNDWIRVRYSNFRGETDTVKFSGMTARYFQQAVDHFNGILFTQRANRYHLDQAKKQRAKLNKLKKKNKV